MTSRLFPLIGIFLVFLSGCAEQAYYRTDFKTHRKGLVKICYSSDVNSAEEIQAMADEACYASDRRAVRRADLPGQCSWSAPSLAVFTCASPDPAPVTSR